MANPLQQFGGAEMRETPRKNKLAGVLADWLAKADQFARAPGGYDNPPAAMLSDALGIPAVQRTLDRYSYGEPLTNAGKANVPLIPQDTADAAMAVAPAVAKWPKQAAGAALGLMGAGADAGAAERAMLLYHGSNMPGKMVIKEGGASNVFDGIFASPSKSSAMSHGDYLHEMDVPDHLIMPSGAPDMPRQKVEDALRATAGSAYKGKAKDAIWRAVVNDDPEAAQSLVGVLGDSAGAASWEAQRLRGQVASRLGYKASAMNDEHGTSYLIRPGVDAKLIQEPAAQVASKPAIELTPVSTQMGSSILKKHGGDYAAAIAAMEALGPSAKRGFGYEESLQALRGQMFDFKPSMRGGDFKLRQ